MMPGRLLLGTLLMAGLTMVLGAAARSGATSQPVNDQQWTVMEHERDIRQLAIEATRLPVAAILSLSHDTDAQARLEAQLKAQPGGQKTVLSPPYEAVKGLKWYVVQGQLDILSHRRGTNNAYAWDLVLVDEKARQTQTGKSGNESHYCWGMPVLAPAAGVVRKLSNGNPDHAPSAVPKDNGNWVILDHGNGEATALWHFKQGSIVLKVGERVKRGQKVGECGNSGSSLFPHIHMQLDKYGADGGRTAAPAVLGLYLSGKEAETLEIGKSPRRGHYAAALPWPYLGKQQP